VRWGEREGGGGGGEGGGRRSGFVASISQPVEEGAGVACIRLLQSGPFPSTDFLTQLLDFWHGGASKDKDEIDNNAGRHRQASK